MMNDKNLGSQKNKLKEIKRTPELRFKGFSDDWEERKLGDLANIVRGASPRPIQDSKWFDKDSDIGWLRISDVTDQNGRIHHLEQRISKLGQEKTRVLKEPHLLLSIAATVGKPLVNYVKTGVHDGFLIFLNPSFEREFMFQWLEMFRPNWKKYGQPGSQVNLNSELVRNQEIPLPSIEEQQKIGSFFKQLDDTIALHQRKLDKLKQLKQGYLQQLFPKPGETVPKIRFANFEGEWEERKLKQLGEIQTGNTPSTKDSSNYAKNGILWVTPTDIDSLIISDTAKKLSEKGQTKARIAKAGSILVTSIASIGKNALAKTDMGFNQQINSLTPSSENDSYFLLTQSEKWSEMMQRNAAAGTMQIVNKSEFSNIVTEVPKLDEQGQIGNFFAKLDQTITLQLSKINKLKSIKQALLQKMFI
ncbi:restriction endonuclease subunit S [Lactococcus petauri]|uniref:restriction endonuclease subunit S n=1 Tax=Lactococcus petauri TaxID=1940789 RepID=UPI0022E66FC3|nr:restriction endonuclease subunit S [Lactococcus petauri]